MNEKKTKKEDKDTIEEKIEIVEELYGCIPSDITLEGSKKERLNKK